MAGGALGDLKILEFADFISGPFCAKVMADLGAEVIKVEPPEGDRARRSGPFPGDIPHPEKSALFLYLNTNKLGVTLNPESTTGKKIFHQLVRDADILIENHFPSTMEALGLDYGSLSQINPRLVMVSISPFGQNGPYRDYRANNLVSMHMGGIAYYTPGAVDNPETEPPLKGGGHQADFVTGIMAALMGLAGIAVRSLTGAGQHIDLSAHEAVAFNLMRDISSFSYDGVVPSRLRSQSRGFGNFVPCKDGYVQLYAVDDRQWKGFVEAMGDPEWAKEERYANAFSRIANWESLEKNVAEWTRRNRKEDIYHALQSRHASCGPVNTVEEVLRSGQLASRGFFIEVDHPKAGRFKYPGAPCKLSETPFRVLRPAPRLGEHNEEILVERLGYTRQDLAKMRASDAI
ncbi:MAG: CoA transferase [Deltaproteobacteria bacterium]|nr:CoA transferase [Deltaproteobacteria bacterium]